MVKAHLEIIHITYPLQNSEFTHSPQVMAIGDFDGVHLGHKEVLKRTLQIANELNIPATIMTFHPHPRFVLGQDNYKDLITPLFKKMEIFNELGISRCYVVSFDQTLMQLSPDDFIHQIILPLHIQYIVVGFDFTFGYKGLGNADTLCELGKGQFAVEVIRPYFKDEKKVSSRFIRESLLNGNIKNTTQLLDRPYTLRGTVIHGQKLGRTIGFPTANLQLDEHYLIPKHGVYAVRLSIRNSWYTGVMNVGIKPTIEDKTSMVTIEVHIFDFNQEIYGDIIEISMIEFLRSEQKFPNIDILKQQIHADSLKAKEIISQM